MSSLAPALRVPARLLLTGLLALGLVLVGPVGTLDAAHAKKGKKPTQVAKIHKATNTALRQIGDPYRYGAAGPGSFDCSGLIFFSYRQAGLAVPRTSSAQAQHTRRIAKSNLKRGDLMFFHNRGRVYHAAIFLGREKGRIKMLHSPSSGKRVERSTPWTSSWFAGTLRGRR